MEHLSFVPIVAPICFDCMERVGWMMPNVYLSRIEFFPVPPWEQWAGYTALLTKPGYYSAETEVRFGGVQERGPMRFEVWRGYA